MKYSDGHMGFYVYLYLVFRWFWTKNFTMWFYPGTSNSILRLISIFPQGSYRQSLFHSELTFLVVFSIAFVLTCISVIVHYLKRVSIKEVCMYCKGQLISKANFEVFIWTKNQRKYFCISAQASKRKTLKKGLKQKIKVLKD